MRHSCKWSYHVSDVLIVCYIAFYVFLCVLSIDRSKVTINKLTQNARNESSNPSRLRTCCVLAAQVKTLLSSSPSLHLTHHRWGGDQACCWGVDWGGELLHLLHGVPPFQLALLNNPAAPLKSPVAFHRHRHPPAVSADGDVDDDGGDDYNYFPTNIYPHAVSAGIFCMFVFTILSSTTLLSSFL